MIPQSTPSEHAADSAKTTGFLDRFFEISTRHSSVGREVRGGVATFFSMAYIVVLNPLILGTVADSAGEFLGGGDVPNLPAIAAATSLVSGLLTILMGLVGNFPMAVSSSLGLSALLTYGIVALPGMTWADAMGLVVIEGIIRSSSCSPAFAPRSSTPCRRSSRPRSAWASDSSSP